MIPAAEALQRLKDGNARFVAGEVDSQSHEYRAKREELANGQYPFAIVLGCSDSRVPVEIVFDQGLGDVFVIRVAGNIAAHSQIGSIEYAVQNLGTRLAVVLAHTRCGAVRAAVAELNKPSEQQSPNLRFIVDRIRPAVDRIIAEGYGHDPDALVDAVVRENARLSVEELSSGSEIIANLIAENGLKVVGAEYCLQTGKVEFL